MAHTWSPSPARTPRRDGAYFRPFVVSRLRALAEFIGLGMVNIYIYRYTSRYIVYIYAVCSSTRIFLRYNL